MMPILHSPGLIMPGQLGPMRRVCDCSVKIFLTFTMSCCGMPSVMHTIRSSRAAMPSRMASAANAGGTYNTDALAPAWQDVVAQSWWLQTREVTAARGYRCPPPAPSWVLVRNGLACLIHRLLHRFEDRQAEVRLPALLRVDATNHMCPILDRLQHRTGMLPVIDEVGEHTFYTAVLPPLHQWPCRDPPRDVTPPTCSVWKVPFFPVMP